MRYVPRVELDSVQIKYLEKQQKILSGTTSPFSSTAFWDNRYETVKKKGFLAKLFSMAGTRRRCMYCVDSNGTDIEHFHPKSLPPFEKMFYWENWLLCCTDCGRNNKGIKFPVDTQGVPLLIDPTTENPWQHLDFDPTTGNITATYQVVQKDVSQKGQATVKVLALDNREQLAEGYLTTWNRLIKTVRRFLKTPYSETEFITKLLEKDDHHLLGWCFHGTGDTESPFSELKQQHPELWQQFVNHPELLIPATQEIL